VVGSGPSSDQFWLWDAARGRRTLQSLLPAGASGWQMDGTNLAAPHISNTGVIVGSALYNGQRRPYVAFYENSTGLIGQIVNLG
jgi:hypothetical protein